MPIYFPPGTLHDSSRVLVILFPPARRAVSVSDREALDVILPGYERPMPDGEPASLRKSVLLRAVHPLGVCAPLPPAHSPIPVS